METFVDLVQDEDFRFVLFSLLPLRGDGNSAGAGIEAVIQSGGSVNDEDLIDAADDHDMAMAFTGQRAFKH